MITANPSAQDHIKLADRVSKERSTLFALPSYRKAVTLAPKDVEVWLKFAKALGKCRQFQEEERVLEAAYQLNPQDERLFYHIGSRLEVQHRLTELEQFLAANKTPMGHTDSYLKLSAALDWRNGLMQQAKAKLVQALALDNGNSSIHYRLAKIADQDKQYDTAFQHLQQANQLRSHSIVDSGPNNPFRKKLTRLSQWINGCELGVELRPHCDSPIFLTGFPRSGNTLMGCILDAHPALSTADEHQAIKAVIREISFRGEDYPHSLDSLTQQQLEMYRKIYRQNLVKNSIACNVDKSPFNLVHLPLIWRLFPGARILVMIRHPLDVCLSCYFQNFTDNAAMRNFLSLEWAADTYCEVMALFKAYRQSSDVTLHVVRYEQLTTDFSATMSQALAFLDLPWSDEIHQFYQKAQQSCSIRTPSYHQVIRPLYTHGNGRWRHYDSYLEPIKDRLSPWCDYFGYTL